MKDAKWRACVLYNPQNPSMWDEIKAETFDELLEKLKQNSKEPFRIIIYRKVN